MLEYIPGKYAHRPIDAEGYMFIHFILLDLKTNLKERLCVLLD